MKKFHHIWVGYGKKQMFVRAMWVHEDFLENYKTNLIAEHRARGWKKDFIFIENTQPCIEKEDGVGTIFAIGADGKSGTYRVA